MRKGINIICAAVAVILSVTACRTNEQTYRRAYESARQAEIDRAGGETVYTAIRREARREAITAGGDTITMTTEFVSLPKGETTPSKGLLRYSVVAGQFKQLFHARSLRTRLAEKGFPDAFIVQTREPYYYVVAETSASIDSLLPTFRMLRTAPPMPLVEPCPWILRAPNH